MIEMWEGVARTIGEVKRNRRGREEIICHAIPSLRFPFHFQQTCKTWDAKLRRQGDQMGIFDVAARH